MSFIDVQSRTIISSVFSAADQATIFAARSIKGSGLAIKHK